MLFPDICENTFKIKYELKAHHTIHSDEKPFCCIHCGKKFKKKISLILHERVHTGEKPYTCNQCNVVYHLVNELHLVCIG